jgi:F-type H+-transporting ATPase subunit delta
LAADEIVSGVAGRYAGALFDIVDGAGAADRTMGELDAFARALDESADLDRLVRSPVFGADEQLKALDALLPRLGVSGPTANLFKLLAQNRRLFLAREVVTAFRRLVAAKRGGATAEVVSAEPLSDAQAQALKDALSARSGKTVELDRRVDASLIGGLVVKLGSRMIDTSLRTKLAQLKLVLKEVR